MGVYLQITMGYNIDIMRKLLVESTVILSLWSNI